MIKRVIIFLLSFCIVLVVNAQVYNQSAYYTDSSVYDVKFYEINISASSSSTYIEGLVRINAVTINKNLQIFYIELSDSLNVEALTINGINQTFQHKNGWIKSQLNSEITANTAFEVVISYKGVAASHRYGGSVEINNIYNTNILYVLSEPYFASDFFPCKQWLTDKVDSVTAIYTVPIGQMAIANGLLKQKIKLPENKTLYRWETHYSMAFYLIAFAISSFNEYSYSFYDEQFNDSIRFTNYIYSDSDFFNESKKGIDRTVEMIKLFEQLTGVAYPFRKEKYGHITAPIGGGMENQTITMLSDFGFDLVAHELAHSWFGNLVTCSDWQHIWVNEGITSYMEYLANEKLEPETAKIWLQQASHRAFDEPNGSVYVPFIDRYDERRIFNYNLTYRKGAMILHMLRRKINNDVIFFKVLNTYLNTFAFKNANTDDFRRVAEEESGLSLKPFFYQWYYSKGYPIVQLDWKILDNKLQITTIQSGSSLSNPVFDFDLDILVKLNSGIDSLITLRIKNMYHEFEITFAANPVNIDINPNYTALAQIQTYPAITNDAASIADEPQLLAYPNPFNDSLNIKFPMLLNEKTIRLFNTQGRLIKEWVTSQKELEIDSPKILPGIYILYATDGYRSCNLKIQKL